MNSGFVSARTLGVAGCHTCGKAVHLGKKSHVECPRCGAEVHYRKHDSVRRAWAFLIAAFIMYIPANTEPMMRTTALGTESADTIMEGVIYFLSHGDYLVGLVIFAASVMLPLLKMMALAYIYMMAEKQANNRRKEQNTLYKLAEILGKWSMLDIFVVGLMAGLVQLGGLTSIAPGPACIAFAAVVILTMISEMLYDPKLTWDEKVSQ
ncbi:MAG: paraquat-inducible protein A [bacterium]